MRGVAVAGGSRLRAGASVLTIVRGLAASRRIDAAGDVLHHAGFDNVHSLEARSRGPRPRCLRFAAFLPALAVVGPRKTRFRVVANLCRAGLEPAGSQMKFQLCLHGILLIQAFPTQAGGVTAASPLRCASARRPRETRREATAAGAPRAPPGRSPAAVLAAASGAETHDAVIEVRRHSGGAARPLRPRHSPRQSPPSQPAEGSGGCAFARPRDESRSGASHLDQSAAVSRDRLHPQGRAV